MPCLEVTTKKPELRNKKGKRPDKSEHAFTVVPNSYFSRFSRQNESKPSLQKYFKIIFLKKKKLTY